jgi:hypothetical protein
MKKSFLLVPLLLAISLEAVVEKRINEKNPIPIVFSRSSHNRICVEGGAVEKIIGDGAIFSVTLDASTGNAFINVLQDVLKPITLTVVTSSGFIQDLLVSSQDCPSEQVVLKEIDEWDGVDIDTYQEATTVEMLNKILEGKIPFGYGQRAVGDEETLGLPKPLKAETLKVFEGPLDTLFVYRIKNDSKQAVVVMADSLKKENRSWVFLNVQELDSNQEALCVIAYPKDRN